MSLIADKKWALKIVDVLSHGAVYLAISSASLMYVIELLLGVEPNIYLISAAGFIAYSIYLSDRIAGFHEDFINHTQRAIFVKRNKKILTIVALLSYTLGLIFISHVGYIAVFVAFVTIIAGILYGTNFIPEYVSSKYKKFKQIFLVKNLFISSFWTLGLVGVNILPPSNTPLKTISVVVIFLFLKVFMNTILFDARDIYGDKKKGISTLPVKLGFEKTKKIIMVINILLCLFIILVVFIGWLPKVALFINLITLYTIWYLKLLNKKNAIFVCDFIVEGEDIIMAVFGYTGSILLG